MTTTRRAEDVQKLGYELGELMEQYERTQSAEDAEAVIKARIAYDDAVADSNAAFEDA